MTEGSTQYTVVVFPGALGDFLLALPAIRHLAGQAATAAVTLVVSEPLRALAGFAVPHARIECLDGASSAWLFGGSTRPPWLDGRPVLHAWIGLGDPTVARRLAEVTTRFVLYRVVREEGPDHAAVAYANAVGLPARDPYELAPAGRLAVPGSSRAREVLERMAGRPRLVLHRGAGADAKRWCSDGFALVAAAWRECGGCVIDLLGPAERAEAALTGTLAIRDWPLPDVAALLAAVEGYVGCDSGISHLAGAVGARGIVIFGPTQPRRWRPLGTSLVALAPRAGEAVVCAREVLGRLTALSSLTTPRADTIDPP